MNEERIDSFKLIMEKEGLDALVLRLPENVLFLSGYWPMFGFSFLLFPKDQKPVLIIGECEKQEAQAEVWDADCITYKYGTIEAENAYTSVEGIIKKLINSRNWKKIGFEGNFEIVSSSWNTAEVLVPAKTTMRLYREVFGEKILVDVTDILYRERGRKTLYEVGKIRIANEIAAIGLRTFFERVDTGAGGVEIVAAVESAITWAGTGYKGSRRVRGFAQVATGKEETSRAYRPNEITTRRKLQPGDLAMLELAVVADGFWSDRTRVRVAGKPDDRQLEVYEAVRKAQEKAMALSRPGIGVREVDSEARALISKAGYGNAFPHITGHGVGFGYHEPIPTVSPKSDDIFEPGMICTVEPGIYIPDLGGIRIEDNIVITENGCEILGPFDTRIG
ncbi:MAG: Xaa-Pro peptidase family protein [Spirochaetota bacterium]